ncbi:hypothetical protein SELSPUOL_01931 [Selenomonas sputigena ATCC 35185]|uniref:Uncharacterized protein n=1 Tax=Selenomonas sputigena (strain ATCC 35185 / DSM 20758 / CCUG 44933 / VPI D19B-28) TaxID=546271 RepID=C9LWS6_SELS3|nr:hypothetical protein SELSPUOL_01931 [Selenomonas sputigena ATCC 35185]
MLQGIIFLAFIIASNENRERPSTIDGKQGICYSDENEVFTEGWE